MAYNPNILPEVLKARSLSRRQLSERLGLDAANLDEELSRTPEPRQGILKNIARELALPPFIFFMERLPSLHDVIPDFRSSQPAPRAKCRETVEAIQFAEGIQRAAIEGDVSGVNKNLPQFTATMPVQVDKFALKARIFFDITEQDQEAAKDAREFYVICRKKIEEKGIFVLHDSFPEQDGSGFCLSHPLHPVILINTKRQTRGRRLFTLGHELGHVLMRKTGISDPFVRENSVETLCNRFAGAFFAPESFVLNLLGRRIDDDPDFDAVRWASRRLKISQEATVLRLEQLGLYRHGSYEKWKKIIHNFGNPDFSERGGGGTEPPPQEKVKLAKYGFHFAAVFNQLLRDGQISELNIFRSTGLKPRYQRPYFDYVENITSNELQGLELDDE